MGLTPVQFNMLIAIQFCIINLNYNFGLPTLPLHLASFCWLVNSPPHRRALRKLSWQNETQNQTNDLGNELVSHIVAWVRTPEHVAPKQQHHPERLQTFATQSAGEQLVQLRQRTQIALITTNLFENISTWGIFWVGFEAQRHCKKQGLVNGVLNDFEIINMNRYWISKIVYYKKELLKLQIIII